MNKKLKKISLLSTFAALSLPMSLLVSCGPGLAKKTFEYPDFSKSEGIKLDTVDLSELKDAATNSGIKKQDIESISIDDLQKYRLSDSTLDTNKKQIIEKMEKVLLDFNFNNNNIGKNMKEIQKWINNSSLSVYNSQSTRGPWRSKESSGSVKYYRDKLINLRYINGFKGYDLVGSKFVENAPFKSDRFIKNFNKSASPKKGDRIFDNSFSYGNGFSATETAATSFAIYRSEASGNYTYTRSSSTGELTWDSKEEIKNKLFDGINIQINNQSPSDNKFKSAIDISKNAPKNTSITFSTNKNVNYSKTVSGKITDSKIKFKAKDLFYGFVRNLYSSKDFRKTAKVDGVDISNFLEPFTKDEEETWNNLFENADAANAFDNKNFYLFDLYGIDILETIKSNINGADDDKFVIAFKNFNPTSLEIFKNTTLFTPFPKSMVIKKAGATNKINATSLSVFDYGNPYPGSGKINIENVLSIAPFLYSNYSVTEKEDIIIKQNPFYADQDWVNDPLSIKGYSTEIITNGSDASSFAQTRLKQFLNAKETEEYILDSSVKSQSSLLKQVEAYKVYKKPLRNGVGKVLNLNWNFYGFGDDSFNSLGKKMMWGQDSNIKTNPSSISTFFSGDGAKVRASINSAINWYAMSQSLFPNQNKEFYPGISFEDEFKISNVDTSLAFPNYLSSASDLKNIYDSNTQNRYKAWTPKTIYKAAKTLNEIATKVGATNDNPAKIGIFKYIFTDTPVTPAQKQTNLLILDRLNHLTPKLKFFNQKDYSWSEFINHGMTKQDSSTIIFGFSPDYSGLGSILQQYLGHFGTFSIVGLFRDAFGIASS